MRNVSREFSKPEQDRLNVSALRVDLYIGGKFKQDILWTFFTSQTVFLFAAIALGIALILPICRMRYHINVGYIEEGHL